MRYLCPSVMAFASDSVMLVPLTEGELVGKMVLVTVVTAAGSVMSFATTDTLVGELAPKFAVLTT